MDPANFFGVGGQKQWVGGREPGGRDEGDSQGSVQRMGGKSREEEGATVESALCALPDTHTTHMLPESKHLL